MVSTSVGRVLRAAAALAIAFGAALAPSASGSTRGAAEPAGFLLVLNKAGNSLAIVDPGDLRVVATVPTGEGPHELVTSPDGRLAYVANYGTQQAPGNTLSIVDLAARKEVKRVDLGPLLRPHGIAESGGKIYFTSEAARAVARYDPAADRVDWVMGTGQTATHMLALAPGGKRIYTANIGSDTVTMIEAGGPASPPNIAQIAVGRAPEGIDVSPDGREVWVGQNGDGNISIIDTATGKVKETVRAGKVPIRVKFTPDGSRVLVSDPESGEVAVFDAAARRELKRIAVGGVPIGILVAPGGGRAFVALAQANKVAVLDLATLAQVGAVEPGQGPDGLAWAARP